MSTPLLEPPQYKLLAEFVQAPRGEFFVTHPHNDAEPTFIHRTTNERFQGSESDAAILVANLLLIKLGRCFAVTPAGIDHYNMVAADKMRAAADE